MRSLLGGLAAILSLLLCLPATGAAATGAPATGPPASPTCASGPARVGEEIVGTPCADVIVAPADVETVRGGGGDDTILGANSGPVAAVTGSCETGCHLEVGSQTFEGGPGNDVVFGDRGNDTLRGNAGNDRLYGGIGDDALEGGEGNDLLSGGFGADKIDGQAGDDYVRGDATIDHIFDSGGGTDTLSFSTGVTPGFSASENPTPATNFPGPEEGKERGVWLKLDGGGNNALDGEPSLGGGNDEVQPGVFERIIGTPFSDYIVGSSSDEQIYGGGGADAIEGGEGNDLLNGGADGDYLDGGAGDNTIEAGAGDNCFKPAVGGCGSAKTVKLRETSKVSVGETTGATGLTQVYVVGRESADEITATFTGSSVTVSIAAGSFNADLGGCDLSNPTTASCPVSGLLDSVLLAGMAGNDIISATNFPDGVGVLASGGEGEDTLTGGAGEDVLVDGPGDFRDILAAAAGDDALTHNGGADLRDGGEGSDLFLSVALCQGESIVGGTERVGAPVPDRDNASWARLGGVGADARIDQGRVGEVRPGDPGVEPECASGSPDTLSGIEDLEGSNQDDYLVGDGGNNQLLGHKGADSYFGLAGQDSLLANSGTRDQVIDCGADLDSAVIDLAAVGDPTPVECESVREGAPEEFKELPLLRPPVPPPPPPVVAPKPPPRDRTPPRTRIRARPRAILTTTRARARAVFRFTANERGSSFRCKLDRKPYRPCASPRVYMLAPGRHTVRIFAIDRAGNPDRTPALLSLRVRRR